MAMFPRSLAWLTSLLLIAPQGWCCSSPPQAEKNAPETKQCCHCPESSDQPEIPEPSKPCECGLDSTVPAGAETFNPDLVLVSLPVGIEAGLTGGLSLGLAAPAPHSLSPPLQLLHCVWLC